MNSSYDPSENENYFIRINEAGEILPLIFDLEKKDDIQQLSKHENFEYTGELIPYVIAPAPERGGILSVYTKKEISKNKNIAVIAGKEYFSSQMKQYNLEDRYIFDLPGKKILYCKETGNITRFINGSSKNHKSNTILSGTQYKVEKLIPANKQVIAPYRFPDQEKNYHFDLLDILVMINNLILKKMKDQGIEKQFLNSIESDDAQILLDKIKKNTKTYNESIINNPKNLKETETTKDSHVNEEKRVSKRKNSSSYEQTINLLANKKEKNDSNIKPQETSKLDDQDDEDDQEDEDDLVDYILVNKSTIKRLLNHVCDNKIEVSNKQFNFLKDPNITKLPEDIEEKIVRAMSNRIVSEEDFSKLMGLVHRGKGKVFLNNMIQTAIKKLEKFKEIQEENESLKDKLLEVVSCSSLKTNP